MIRKNTRAQGGFTLIETILSIAILVVLLAVSVTGAILYRSYLKITELDNAAREIYLAAQNRAVLLSNRSALQPLLVRTDNQLQPETANEPAYYYISDEDAQLSQLLPSGTVDPALLDGSFYIVYEPESGSVTDVFFQQGAKFTLPDGLNFDTYYSSRSYREKKARRQAEPMTGWYNGDPGEDGDAVTLQPPDIIIYNEDTLRAEIKWWVPRVLSGQENDIALKVSVTYGEGSSETTVALPKVRCISQDKRIDAASITHTDVYLLDSLFKNYQFKDLFTSMGLGGSFTLTAEVSYTGSGKNLQINPGRASETDNSLFAKDSTNTAANIAYMRHLQNLHPEFSGVSSTITAAVQTRAIENPSLPESYDGTGVLEGTTPYHFTPIQNNNLTAYDGNRWEIRHLLIKTEGNAGLFDRCVDTFTDVRLMNPTVQGNGYVGTLCAQAMTGAKISGCQSYWVVDDASQMDLRYLLGTAEKDTYNLNDYAVKGNIAGGLVGAGEKLTITSSSASATVSGTTTAGGLVGQASGLTLQNSYADCYLTGGSAAGLVGELRDSSNTFTNIYAAGFISNDGSAAGLYLGEGTATVQNSYAAMGYNDRGTGNNEKILPLASSGFFGDDVCYLKLNFMTGSSIGGRPLESTGLTKLADEGTIHGFVKNGASSTRAYNLQADMALTSYPYPGLDGLTHYGDWPDILQINSLVYWENYEKDTDYTGIYGGNANLLKNDLGLVINDGYAVVLGKDRVDALGGTVTIEYDQSGKKTEVTYSTDGRDGNEKLVLIEASIGGVDGTYYLAKLPTKLVNTDTGERGFYQKIVITPAPGGDSSGTQSVSDTYYYCPHFANTALAAEADRVPDPPASVAVRSPRHLYHLSRLGVYSNNTAANCSYTFVQQMDIDYSKYVGSFDADGKHYDAGLRQRPIGDPEKDYVFSEVYNGGSHTISSVPLEPGTAINVGLFGHNSGSILNTVFLGDTVTLSVNANGSSTTRYVGGLCGSNQGVISNCAVAYVKLSLNAYGYSTIVAGGLVGINSGQISRCSAATDGITLNSTNSNGYVGGFAGQNASGGSIDSCYALAAIAADGGIGIGSTDRVNVVAAGFAAENRGNLSNSYAAADLSVSRGAVSHAFCPGLSVNCCYLNSGNFVYVNDKLFSIQNDTAQDIAAALVWDKLRVLDDLENPLQGFTADDSGSGHVLPCIVTDSGGRPHHYGNTITALELGAVGMYYWEHEAGGNGGYHFSVVTINTVVWTISEYSTLCTNHADGGVIDEYGYGYFWAGEDPAFSHQNITLGNKNTEAAAALRKLMNNDRYQFVAYTTAGASYSGSGAPDTYIDGTAKSGSWSFEVGGNTFTFTVNPFFADAFALTSETPAHYKNALVTHIGMPGTENHPFGVRAVAQLQLINWNSTQHNAARAVTKVGNNDSNANQFPYLNNYTELGGEPAVRYWKQSHDVTGGGTSFTPIAGFVAQDNQTEHLYGWFGGSYDGDSYTIQEVNIAADTACVGLFGVTYNATLKNIVMYSPSGTASVTRNRAGTSWYAVGGLVGLAATNKTDAVITNCAIAGYQIKDESGGAGYGGGGVGGLLGICNMALEKCTAVTDITIDFRHDDKGRNIRVGGIAGSCQQSISSCYAGGNITVTSGAEITKSRIHVGGIVGGAFMKPLTNPNGGKALVDSSADVKNSFSNCYSFVSLPGNLNLKDENYNDHLFAVGGVGELGSSSTYTNCYYLKDRVSGTPSDDSNENVTGLIFSEMDVSEPGSQFLTMLNNGGAGFSTVTTATADGQDIDGKYSYSTAPELQGLNYPFPTILSMNDGGRTVNVHYGDWPLGGIERADGSGPVRVDLFADYQPVRESGNSPAEEDYAAYQDVDLWPSELLTKVYPGGEFELAVLDEESAKVCSAELLDPPEKTGEKILRITGLIRGSAKVTVKYMDGDTELASIEIPVDVAAELQLAPRVLTPTEGADPPETRAVLASGEAVILIGAGSQLDLYPFDVNGDPIDEKLWEKVTLTTGENPFQFDKQYISSVTAVTAYEGACLTAALEGTAPTTTPTTLTVNYTYTYQGQDYTDSNTIICQVRTLTAGGKPLLFFGTEDDKYGGEKRYEAGMLTFRTEDNTLTPENVTFTSAIGSAVDQNMVVRVEYYSAGTVTVQPRSPGQETMHIGVSFSYGLCRHKTTVYPIAAVYDIEQGLHLLSDNIQGEELVIHTAPADSGLSAASEGAPAAAAVVSIQEYVAGSWNVQWMLDTSLTPYLAVAEPAARTAELTLSGEELSEEMTGKLTVTVTTDVLDANGAPYILEGSVSVRILPGSPTEPTETPGSGDAPVEPADTPHPQIPPRRRRSGTVEKKEPVWRAPQKN